MKINLTFHPLQEIVYNDNHRFKIINCGRRWGKSFLASNIVIIEALKHDKGTYWLVSPTFAQTQIIFRMIKSKLPPGLAKIHEAEKYLELPNGSTIWAKSGDNENSLRGEGLDGVVIDEASRVKEDVWRAALFPALIDKEGWAILISTPKGYNWYYDEFQKGNDTENPKYDSYQSFKFSSYDNPFLKKSEIDIMAENLPDLIYQQEILAQFIEGGGEVFRNFTEVLADTLQDPLDGEMYIGGVDLGRHNDFTVISIMKRATRQIVYLERFNKLDWDYVKMRVEAAGLRYNNALLFLDSTGIGDPVYEDLAKKGCNVRGIKISYVSKPAMINALSIMIENKQIWMPNDPELKREFQSYSYTTTPDGNVKYGAPAGMHDDIVMSIALIAYGTHCYTECIGMIQSSDDDEDANGKYWTDEEENPGDWEELEDIDLDKAQTKWVPVGLRSLNSR